MNKAKKTILLLFVLAGLSLSVNAAVTVFNPSPIDLKDLPHQYYYTWGINYSIPEGESITGATLTFYNIYDWTKETNDRLFTHLLDNPSVGVKAIKEQYDNQTGGDNFAGQGVLVGVWSDPAGGKPTNFNLVYDFDTLGLLDELTEFINTPYGYRQSNFGFGIDPDCHYYNCKVEFVITTASAPSIPTVPAPAAVSLGSMGIVVVGWLRMRRAIK